MKTLTELDYQEAAAIIGCDVATIKTVAKVEANGSGFNKDGTPKILFEGHWFHKLTNGRFSTPLNFNISYPKWIRTYYNENQHKRLHKAVLLDREAALMSASWGKFQIMGFNYKKCGFSSVQDFVNAIYSSEGAQLKAFCNFIMYVGLDDELRNKEWAQFAYGYNGPRFKENNYDVKLANAYLTFA